MARNDTRSRVVPRVRRDVIARPAGPKQSPRQLFPAPAPRSREIASSGSALSRSASLRGPWLAMTPDRGSFPSFGGMSLRGPKGRSNLLASCPRCGTAITGDCSVGLRPLPLRFASGTMARDVIRPRVFARVRWGVIARPEWPKQSPRQLFPAPALRSREIAPSGSPLLTMTPERGSFPAFGGMSLRGAAPRRRGNLRASFSLPRHRDHGEIASSGFAFSRSASLRGPWLAMTTDCRAGRAPGGIAGRCVLQ
jgi:hypothetical protein